MSTRLRWFGLAFLVLVLSSPPAQAATWVVDRLSDANSAGGGEGSGPAGDLRYTITNAQSGDTVTFTVAGTIHLTGYLPDLARDIEIDGPGANSLTVHGGRIAVSSGATVVLSGLTITGGVGNGGGIFNAGTLTLDNVVVSGNRAGDPTNGGGTGAGIWNYVNATLTLNGSTVGGNTVVGNVSYNPSGGGGIANYGTLRLNNSTVSGNSASQGFGGGIKNLGTLTLNSSTVSANSVTGGIGGGIDNRGTLSARNTIIAGNTGGDLSGALTSEGHNLIGTGGSGFDVTDLVDVNPLLGPLQDNGGPTPTMSPLPGSPAIDYVPGTPAVGFLDVDQRGIARPQGAAADVGAVEVAQQLGVVAAVSQATFSLGETLNATVGLTNPGLPGAADVYIGLVRPDNSLQFVTRTGLVTLGGGSALASLPAFVSGASFANPFSVTVPDFFSHRWTAADPRGTYTFFVVVVKAGALADDTIAHDEVLRVAVAVFSFP